MSNEVQFFDYSVKVKEVLQDKAVQFLEEVGGEIRSQAQRNSRRDTSKTAGSYKKKLDPSGLAVHIGSDYWNAIYEEFGTGEHAINHNGRKGYWVFVKKGGKVSAPKGKGKIYSKDQARRAVAILRKKGLDAYYTKGKKPNKPLLRAFETVKPKAQEYAEKIFGGL